MIATINDISGSMSLGDWLRAARESRGESLEDVAKVTRIGRGYLEAIERGELHKLPSEAYAKGFVRLYANHLGLPADEALSMLQEGSSPSSATCPAAESGGVHGKRVILIPGIGQRRWLIPASLLVFLVVFALISRMRDTAPVAVRPQAPTLPEQPVAHPQTTPSAQEVRTPTPPDMPTEAATQPTDGTPRNGIILRLKAIQAGRLHITIDGAVSQEYDLNEGDLVEWKAEKMFLLELDNAGSVEGDLNGTPLQPLGEPGRSAHLRVDAEGVKPQ